MAKGSWRAEQVEQALLTEIDRIEQRIARFRAQQNALKAALSSHRMEKLRFKGAVRKNSFTRLVAQKRVLDALKQRSSPTPAPILQAAVNKGHENEPMPDTTFRSLLYRMKQDGLIASGPLRGTYMLPPPKSN